jgi:DNA-binding cell septation regulator SpoVG
MKLLIKEFKKYEQNTLQAFVDIELLDLCLVIKGCTVHQKDGSAWIGFPGRSYEDDGTTKWANILEFSSKERKEEFQSAAVEAVRKFVEMENEKASAPTDKTDDEIPF